MFDFTYRYMGPVIEGQSPVDKYSYLGKLWWFFEVLKLNFVV